MAFTLEHISEKDEANLRDTFAKVGAMGDRIGGWRIDKSTINQKSAALFLKWDEKVSPMDNRDLPTVFDVAPEMLYRLIAKLIGDTNEEKEAQD